MALKLTRTYLKEMTKTNHKEVQFRLLCKIKTRKIGNYER